MKLKINSYMILPSVFITLLYISCFFSLETLKYVDEIIALWALIYVGLVVAKKKLDSLSRATIVFLCFMSSIGVLSNIIFHYQKSWLSVFEDAFIFVKPFITFLAWYIFCKNKRFNFSLRDYFLRFSKIATAIVFVTLLVGLAFNIPSIAFYSEWANFEFLKIFVFFTGYPGQLAVLISSLIMIQIVEYEHSLFKYILMNLISIFFTQSGVGFIAIFILFVFFVIRKVKKIRWYHIVLLVIGGVLVGYNEIYYYLLTDTAARSVLLKYGFITAKRFFPLGAGFANYGSNIAATDYARLYTEYGFNRFWGMGQGSEYDFLHDSFYPIIIGEFGFIGTLIYIVYLFKQFEYINNITRDRNLRYALLFSFVLVLVMNLGQGSFCGNVGSIYMILWGLFFSKAYIDDIENQVVN